jgi:RNA polymerase sigma factor (sigma-70 family)
MRRSPLPDCGSLRILTGKDGHGGERPGHIHLSSTRRNQEAVRLALSRREFLPWRGGRPRGCRRDRRRDAAGLAAAAGEYAQGLYAYCRSQLTAPADAADALQDTFVVASAKLAGLRDPGRLRAWLFTVARNECHGRLPVGVAAARDEAAGLADEAAGLADAVAGPGAGEGPAGLRAVVSAALTALSPADGEIIELTLRHGLGGADLADVLGVPAARAPALACRARARSPARSSAAARGGCSGGDPAAHRAALAGPRPRARAGPGRPVRSPPPAAGLRRLGITSARYMLPEILTEYQACPQSLFINETDTLSAKTDR